MGDSDQQKSAVRFDAEDHYDAGEKAIAKLDDAWAKAALFFRTGWHFGHKAGSIRAQSLLRIHERVEVYRRQFEKGNTMSLLNAIAYCAEENLPLPTWLATAYRESLDSFLLPGRSTSLDEIFHSAKLPTDTPAKVAGARQDWQLGGTIWSEVWDVEMKDESITSFDAALKIACKGRDFGVKKTKARELFLMIDKNQTEHLQSKSFSRFLEIRRKRIAPK